MGLVQQGSLPDTLLLVEVRPSGQFPCLFMDPTAGLGLWANSKLKLRLSGAAVYDHWVRDHLPPPPPPPPPCHACSMPLCSPSASAAQPATC